MWFEFPQGTTQINVHLQNFEPEFSESGKDASGNEYERQFFRAPDHFATTILSVPGFKRVGQPKGAPDDLAPSDPGASVTIGAMGEQVSSLQDENRKLREALSAAGAELMEMGQKLTDAQARVKELEEATATAAGGSVKSK